MSDNETFYETITISKYYFNKLLESKRTLQKLQAAGVDNWEGYSCAMGEDDESYEDIYGEGE